MRWIIVYKWSSQMKQIPVFPSPCTSLDMQYSFKTLKITYLTLSCRGDRWGSLMCTRYTVHLSPWKHTSINSCYFHYSLQIMYILVTVVLTIVRILCQYLRHWGINFILEEEEFKFNFQCFIYSWYLKSRCDLYYYSLLLLWVLVVVLQYKTLRFQLFIFKFFLGESTLYM